MVEIIHANVHPTIRRCLQHLEVIGTDHKTRQLVYMYMETLCRELATGKSNQIKEAKVQRPFIL
ncbi:hypothetical protein [Bacillus sp. MUM 13]|uniref:hypothetical protein n=1 Tax=Bacillus sp. MUM 13 TaxID=1678001 RepID=UPI0011132EF5|nr:hypothetical protein [Bacillus sp. MUM 13]